ncbi:MAG: RNA polymerase sigma factor [Blastocatellia bacterium]
MEGFESRLVERAKEGDHEAFCDLAKFHERRVYSLAMYYCHDSHDAEDLSQEVWLKAYKAIAGFRGESSFFTWLRQIMINTFLNHRRPATIKIGGEEAPVKVELLDPSENFDSPPASHVHDAEERIHNKILAGKVIQALGELTAQQRLIFILKHCEGMTYEEISQSLGCSTGAVKKSLFRTVNSLREHFSHESRTSDHAPAAVSKAR